MPEIADYRIVNIAQSDIYRVVADIKTYPQIFDYIKSVEVLRKSAGKEVARITVGLGPFKFSYVCALNYFPNKQIKIRLIRGPFRHLRSVLTFESTGPSQTKASYDFSCEFKSALMERLAGPIMRFELQRSLRLFEVYVTAQLVRGISVT